MTKQKLTKAQEIGLLFEELQSFEDTDFLYISPDIKELRNKVFYVHTRLETSIDSEITRYLREPYKTFKGNKEKRQEMARRTYDLLEGISYSKKVNFIEEKKLLDMALIQKLKKLNTIRNYFSHPRTFMDKLNEYRDGNKFIEILRFLINVYSEFNKLAGERLKEFDEEDKINSD